MHGIALTALNAVEAGDATAVVDLPVLRIDAGGFTPHAAQSATVAVFIHKLNFKKRKSTQESECGTHGADGVAPGSSVFPCQIANYQKCDKRGHC